MKYKLLLSLGLLLCVGLTFSVLASERVVVCEEAYSETWASCAASSGTLATFTNNNLGRIALIEMHVSSNSYGMYLAEARSRWYSYPPPYWYNGQFVFATPWLWLDGDKHAGYTYSNWGNLISNRMNEESPMAITMWGNYDPSSRTGTVYAKYYNESPEPMTGKVLFVITEDSIQRSVPNGDQWHNHVARDYIPDYIGTQFTIGREDSVIYSQPFTLASNWNVNQCEIVTFFQSTTLTPDSIKEIYQGGTIKVMNLLLPGIEEEHNLLPNHTAYVNVFPNPCQNQTRFELSLPNGTDYKIGIFDISGREIKTLNGVMTGMKQIINCDFPNTIKSGIYFYRLESKKHNSNGKIIIQ